MFRLNFDQSPFEETSFRLVRHETQRAAVTLCRSRFKPERRSNSARVAAANDNRRARRWRQSDRSSKDLRGPSAIATATADLTRRSAMAAML
jgi:hypothetical protein